MKSKSWISCLGGVTIFLFLFEGGVHAGNVSSEDKLMKFSCTTNGAADGSINRYGDNSVSVLGDVMRVQIGDSVNNWNINGVGIYEVKLRGESLENARKLSELLCQPKKLKKTG
ncbi:hypothetical protein [Burkholderia anthina]|uniref:hypothetical protein n=1 Tax=Burkholderia anthina TaxID=179879 RepID=UPI00334227BC